MLLIYSDAPKVFCCNFKKNSNKPTCLLLFASCCLLKTILNLFLSSKQVTTACCSSGCCDHHQTLWLSESLLLKGISQTCSCSIECRQKVPLLLSEVFCCLFSRLLAVTMRCVSHDSCVSPVTWDGGWCLQVVSDLSPSSPLHPTLGVKFKQILHRILWDLLSLVVL